MNEEKNSAAEELWKNVKSIYLGSIKDDVEHSQAERYFGMISSVTGDENVFTIKTMNDYARELIENEYSQKLKGCFIVAGAPFDIEIKVILDDTYKQPIVNRAPVLNQIINKKASTFISTQPLNDYYTFEEFVQGPSNSIAFSAAKAVVQNPGKHGFYNPLFIHGGTGLGKTHLMQAIGNELKKRNPSMAICYLTAETFLNEYISSLQNSAINEFRNKYRNVDVLLIDDVQFLQRGKDNFQEEFFNTFNFLQQAQKQIVMTSDVAPKKLPQVQARLISRFEGGMVQEIESPSYETKVAILKKKCESMEINLPSNVIEFIAENINSHVRAMEGSLMKVNLVKMADPKIELNTDTLNYILKDVIVKEQSLRNLTIEEIQQECAKHFGLQMKDILSHERSQELVTPRQLAMYISRKLTSKGLREIADKFQKTNATVLSGVKTISERLENESELKNELESILATFGYRLSDVKD